MVESMRQISISGPLKGVATARMPKGAVASELANDGKKKTILRDLDNAFSLLKEEQYLFKRSQLSHDCQHFVTRLSRAFHPCEMAENVPNLLPKEPGLGGLSPLSQRLM
jgi:hypothetical protein